MHGPDTSGFSLPSREIYISRPVTARKIAHALLIGNHVVKLNFMKINIIVGDDTEISDKRLLRLGMMMNIVFHAADR